MFLGHPCDGEGQITACMSFAFTMSFLSMQKNNVEMTSYE